MDSFLVGVALFFLLLDRILLHWRLKKHEELLFSVLQTHNREIHLLQQIKQKRGDW